MGSGSDTVQWRLAASLQAACAGEDPRRVRTAAWLVAGLLLEQDARLSRIALAMAEPASQEARERRLRRWLDGPFDVHACYRVLVGRLLRGWRLGSATVVLDTSSVCGRLYYVRVGLVHDNRCIPLAWRCLTTRSATVDFASYRPLLEAAEGVLPRGADRMLLADRGFLHVRLLKWCDAHGWRYRIRAKQGLRVQLPDGTCRAVRDFRSMPGALRVLDTVHVTGHRYGPAGLLLCWPQYGGDSALHVLSSDAPSVRTLWEFRQLAAVERGFRDDKSGCFGLERVRLTSPERLERLLFGIAVAELYLKSLGTRTLLQGAGHEVDAHREGGHSLLQLGARFLRRCLWRGVTPPLTLGLVPDAPMAGRSDERATLQAFYRRLGLVPGQRWVPPDSFEERNVLWWLPGNVKRYPPRQPVGNPPLL